MKARVQHGIVFAETLDDVSHLLRNDAEAEVPKGNAVLHRLEAASATAAAVTTV